MTERESIGLWSTTAATNATADPNVGWAEGQLPSTVNNSARAMMAAVARDKKDNDGSLTTAGSANAYTLTINNTWTAYANGQKLSFKASFTNTGAVTLNVTNADATALGAKAIRGPGDTALPANAIISGGRYNVQYDTTANASAGGWVLLNLNKRALLSGATNFYVRTAPLTCTISIASPGVVTRASHGLSANDPFVPAILPNTAAISVTIASPAVVSWFLHAFSAGQPFKFSTTNGALPTGITAGTTYYVISAGLVAGVSFQFSATVGGAAVNTSGTQSGSHFGETVGTMPTGLLADGTIYYVKTVLDANTFTLSATPGGAVINTTGSTAGTITFTTGSDTNPGTALTRTGAFLTPQGAFDYINANYDLSGFGATVNLSDSIYYSATSVLYIINSAPLGTPSNTPTGIAFVGNVNVPANVTFNAVSAAILASWSGQIMISGVKLTSTGSDGVYCSAHGRCDFTGNVEFGACLSGYHIHANVNGVIVTTGNYRISGAAGGHLYSGNTSTIELNSATVTITNSPVFTTFATAINRSVITSIALTWTGLATGSRFNADAGTIITGGSLTYYPGNAVGTLARGGNYDQVGIPYFSASLSAAQTVTSGSGPNLVNFNTENADSNGWYDNATNYRFTPLIPGKYRIHLQLEGIGTSVTTAAAYVYKNGSNYARSLNNPTANGFLGVSVSVIVDMNGSTDYIDGRALITATGTCQINGGSAPIVSWLEGVFIAP